MSPKLKKILTPAVIIVAAGVLLWPILAGGQLRTRAARHLLDTGWHPDYRALPLLAIAHDQEQKGRPDPALLDSIHQELLAHKLSHPEFFWLELSVLELRAGRLQQARFALKQARSFDPKIINMVQGPGYNDFRKAMGL